jgi:hypothetical protein
MKKTADLKERLRKQAEDKVAKLQERNRLRYLPQ